MEDLSIPRLRACVPTTAGALCLLDHKQADAFCKALKAMAYDGAAEPTTDKSPFLRQAQAMDIPLTQPPASSSPTANPDLPSSEQGSTANAEAADGQPPSKKMRGEAPLVASMFSENFLAVKSCHQVTLLRSGRDGRAVACQRFLPSALSLKFPLTCCRTYRVGGLLQDWQSETPIKRSALK